MLILKPKFTVDSTTLMDQLSMSLTKLQSQSVLPVSSLGEREACKNERESTLEVSVD